MNCNVYPFSRIAETTALLSQLRNAKRCFNRSRFEAQLACDMAMFLFIFREKSTTLVVGYIFPACVSILCFLVLVAISLQFEALFVCFTPCCV
jgi:hypothetical protein